MAEIRIFDSAFLPGTRSASIGGDNLGVGPSHFTWRQGGHLTHPTFFTDAHISEVAKYGGGDQFVGLLLEPRSLREDHHKEAIAYKNLYRTILTYDAELLKEDGFEFYPYGGSWISFDKWGVHEKTKDISIIASEKNTTEGHKIRHEIIKRFGDQIDVYGHGYKPIESKFEALAPYRYSIIVESGRFDYYFTEKLIDCLSVGTIPIYWGCPSIHKFFNLNSIFDFEDFNELELNLATASRLTYDQFWEGIEDNLELAKQYRICEDWIFENYGRIFEC